jgi:hypothetical protein
VVIFQGVDEFAEVSFIASPGCCFEKWGCDAVTDFAEVLWVIWSKHVLKAEIFSATRAEVSSLFRDFKAGMADRNQIGA